jgi:4-hydroxyphenylpyruvate dioxygenase-like putative hemolysin
LSMNDPAHTKTHGIGRIRVGKVDHICSIVNDIDAALRRVALNFETPPVKVEECTSTAKQNGKEIGRYRLKMAMVGIADNLVLELLQIVDGTSVEQEWLTRHGQTVHHIAVKVKDMERVAGEWEKRGIRILQEDGGKWIYMDTEAILGMNIELIPD